jgi:hypothetical protein
MLYRPITLPNRTLIGYDHPINSPIPPFEFAAAFS